MKVPGVLKKPLYVTSGFEQQSALAKGEQMLLSEDAAVQLQPLSVVLGGRDGSGSASPCFFFLSSPNRCDPNVCRASGFPAGQGRSWAYRL